MAADPAVRGRGHGAAVLADCTAGGRRAGSAEIELHAQVTARRFYERAGYTAVGDGVRGGRHRARDDAPVAARGPAGTGVRDVVRIDETRSCQTLRVDLRRCEDRCTDAARRAPARTARSSPPVAQTLPPLSGPAGRRPHDP